MKKKPYQQRITNIATKLGITHTDANHMVVCEHELKNFYKATELVKIEVDLDKKSLARFKKISKDLKISIDAVVMSTLITKMNADV